MRCRLSPWLFAPAVLLTTGIFLLGQRALSPTRRCQSAHACKAAAGLTAAEHRRQREYLAGSPDRKLADDESASDRQRPAGLHDDTVPQPADAFLGRPIIDWLSGGNDVTGSNDAIDNVADEKKSLPTDDVIIKVSPTPPAISSPEVALGSNCSFILSRDRLVRNCITGDIVGRIPRTVKTRLFTAKVEEDVFKETPGEDTQGRRKAFQDIFKGRAWGHSWDPSQRGLNASGRGATLHWTQEAMAGLHVIITQLKQTLGKSRVRLLDVPCGDMAWMSRFLETRSDIDYTGVDIVPELIDRHKEQFKGRGWTFRHLDVIEEPMTDSYDLVLCRTLLQHLYLKDVQQVLHKLSRSGSRYFLGTTFAREYYNADLELGPSNPGRFRPLNLEVPPLSLIPPRCIMRDGPPADPEGWDHFLGLWELPLLQVSDCQDGKEFTLMGTGKVVYSCVEWSPYIDLG